MEIDGPINMLKCHASKGAAHIGERTDDQLLDQADAKASSGTLA